MNLKGQKGILVSPLPATDVLAVLAGTLGIPLLLSTYVLLRAKYNSNNIRSSNGLKVFVEIWLFKVDPDYQ